MLVLAALLPTSETTTHPLNPRPQSQSPLRELLWCTLLLPCPRVCRRPFDGFGCYRRLLYQLPAGVLPGSIIMGALIIRIGFRVPFKKAYEAYYKGSIRVL